MKWVYYSGIDTIDKIIVLRLILTFVRVYRCLNGYLKPLYFSEELASAGTRQQPLR